MKKVIFTIFGVLIALVLGVLALIYIPSPTFEPVAYKPIRPASSKTDMNRLTPSYAGE